jgi:twinkle protein
MKIKSTITGALYEFSPVNKNNQERYVCPECSQYRKKKNDKCFAWNAQSNVGYCHNCNGSFYVFNPIKKHEFQAPEWKNETKLTDKAVKWFTGRMISQSTLNKMKIYSDVSFMPQFGKEIETICFPFFFQEKLYNIKYRGPNKSFKLFSGAELIFYNMDALLNHDSIIITEGEIDALSFIQCEFDNVVSVPNGANNKLEYLDAYYDLFEPIKRFYLAVDQDTKGIELRDEFIRRLGSEKCFIINFKDCKDANEYLTKYGGFEFRNLVEDAKPVPTKGIVTVENIYNDIRDLWVNGVGSGFKLDEPFDKYITWETGRLAIVTGIPSSGKSEFVDYVITKMNLKYGWRVAYFTPENYPLKYHYGKLFEKIIGKRFRNGKANEVEFEMAFEYIKDNFYYIMNEDDFTVDSIINNAKTLVKTRGVKVVVIDPYNKMDHQYSDSETQYISRFLDKLINFAKFNDVLLFLVAHPRKMDKDTIGKIKVPSLYDISGSANFYNKTDYGIVVHRQTNEDQIMMDKIEVHFSKIKFKHLGNQGIQDLYYDQETGRFGEMSAINKDNWLSGKVEQQIIKHEFQWEQTDKVPF